MSLLPSSPAAASSALSHSTVSSHRASSISREATASSCSRAAAPAAAVFLTPAAVAAPAGPSPAASPAPSTAAAASLPRADRPAAAAAATAALAPCAASAAVAEESLPASAAASTASPAPVTAAGPADENAPASSPHAKDLISAASTGCRERRHSNTRPAAGAAAAAPVAAAETCAAGGAGGAADGSCVLYCNQGRPHVASPCSHVVGAALVAAGRPPRSRRPRCSSNNYVAGMPSWEYVFLRRVGLRDRVQCTWFRPVVAAYASAQAEGKRLLAANASAVAIAAASTAAATGATEIAAAATAAARGRGNPQFCTSGGGVAAAPSGAAAGAAATSAARGAAFAVKQNAGAAALHDGAGRQASFSALFPAAGEAAGTSSSAAAAPLPRKQEAARRTPGTATAATPGATPAGSLNSSSFTASSITRHLRRVGTLRVAGSSSNVVQAGLARSESSFSSSSRVMAPSGSGERSRDAAATTLVGSREALQLQFLLQQEVQQQLQQQQMQQLRLLASSSLSALCGVLATGRNSSGSQEGSGAGAAGAAAAGLPPFSPSIAGASAGESGDFAAVAAAVLQQQHENSLAVQLLQQQVEQLQKQLEEKTSENGVLRRLVAEREEELKEKEKEIAESKKACFLLQSERKHLSKALHAAQQEGMERALENERYLRELLRHKEAEAVRLNEVQQLYVSLMHQQQHQQLAPVHHTDVDSEQQQQQDADELQQQEDEEQQQQGEALSEGSGRCIYGPVSDGTTAVRGGSGSDGSLLLEKLHQEVAAGSGPADVERTTAAAGADEGETRLDSAAKVRSAESEAATAATAEPSQWAAPEQHLQGTRGAEAAPTDGTEQPEQGAASAATGLLPQNHNGRMQWLDVAADDRTQGKQDGTCGSGSAGKSKYPREAAEGTGEVAAAASVLPPRGTLAPGPSPLLQDSLRPAGAALCAGRGATADAAAPDDLSGRSTVRTSTTGLAAAVSGGGASASSGLACSSAAAFSSPTAVLPSGGAAPGAGAPAFSGKTPAAFSSRTSPHKPGAASAAPATTGTAEATSKSTSSSRPSVVNPLLQLLSLSPSWARGASRTVLRGSPGSRPAAAVPGSGSSSSTGGAGALQAATAAGQVTSAGARAAAAAATTPVPAKRLSSSDAARLAALETAAVEEDEEWGVVGYTAHSRHSSSERRPPQQSDAPTSREPRQAASRRGSFTSAAASVAGGSSAAAVRATRGVSPASGAVSASAASPAAAHAASDVGRPAASIRGNFAAAPCERRTEGCVAAAESSINKSLVHVSSAPSSAPSAAASGLSLPASEDTARSAFLAAAGAVNEVAGATAAAPRPSDGRAANTHSVSAPGAIATVLPVTAASSPAAATAPCNKDDAAPGGVTPSDGSARPPSLPADFSALLQTAAAAAAAPPTTTPGAVVTPAGEAAARHSTGAPGPAAAAAAVVAAFARPAVECPVAGCFREGILRTNDRRRGGTAAGGAATEGTGAFLSPVESRMIAQPPVRVRQRLLAHQGPVHACCAVPRLWSFQLLNVCSKPSSSSSSLSLSSHYSFRSSSSSYRGHRQQRAPAEMWGGQPEPGAADEEGDEEGQEDAQPAAARAGEAAERGVGDRRNAACAATAYGHSNDFVLTCGQDGFLALVDATRGFLAYSFLVSPFKSPLLCVDAAADRPLAVVAAADVSLYTVDTLNQRVVASLKGHSGRITACGFLRAAAADDVSVPPPSSPSSCSYSVSSSSSNSFRGSSNTAAAAAEDREYGGKRGEGGSRWLVTSAPAGASSGTAAAAADSSPSPAASHAGLLQRSPSGASYPVGGGALAAEGGSSASTAAGFVADKSRGLSGAGSGGGSRRGVPRALERLVSRALRGAGGEGSATLWSSGLDRTVRFWDVERSACVKTTKLPSAVTFAAASPCGEWLAAAHQSGAVSLINARAEMGEKITTLQLHEGEPAVGLAFHPSGQWLVSVGKDKQVKVVDVRDCREVYALLHIEMRYNVVQAAPSFSPDGNYVVAAAGPHVFCWSLAEERLRARTRLLQQRAAGAEKGAAAGVLGGLGGEGNSANGLQQQRLQGKHAHYQGSAAKRQQALHFSRGWAHRTRAEVLQELRCSSSGGRTAADELFAAAEEWQPPVCMHSQASEIMCLDWQLQHLVTGNRDGSVCFWE